MLYSAVSQFSWFLTLYSPVLLQLLPSEFDSHNSSARTSQHRKHRFSYCCRGLLPLSCLVSSLGADHKRNFSSTGHGADSIENTSCKFVTLLLRAHISGVASKWVYTSLYTYMYIHGLPFFVSKIEEIIMGWTLS
jgi:hypothetical protein